MSIFNGLGGSDLAEGWVGSNKLAEVWAGNNKVWSADVLLAMGPEVYLTFENSMSDNLGTQNLTGPFKTGNGGVLNLGTAEYRGLSGDRFSNYQSSWTNGGTLMCWARTVSVRTTGTLDIIQRNSATGTFNELYIIEDSATNRYFAGCTTGGTWFDVGSPDLGGQKDRQWHHLCVTVTPSNNGTAAYLSLYVDGEFVGSSGVRNVPEVNFSASTELHLAQSRLYNTWTGNLDNVATFNRPLADPEIKAIYDTQKPTMPFIPTITTLVLPDMKQGVAFSQQLAANFTVTSWSATGLPPGTTLSSGGLLSGTPSQITSGTMSVTAYGTNGQEADMTYPWTVVSRFVSLNIPFNSNADIDNFFPIRGFDARTSSSSPRNPAFTFSGMLVAGDNNVVTYWQALHGSETPSENVEWILTTGDVMNTVARPTEIILSSDANFQNQLLLQIGSGNLNLVSRTTGSTSAVRSAYSRTIGTNSNIRVVRSGLNITVYHNGTLCFTHAGTTTEATSWFRTPGRAYSGITMFSTSGQWSSRVSHFSLAES